MNVTAEHWLIDTLTSIKDTLHKPQLSTSLSDTELKW